MDMDEDPLCVFNCDPPRSEEQQQLQNTTIAFARSDRRFWLLTIVAGFFSSTDIPLVEDHLAKLYRSAFARQQAKHLGISRDSVITLNNISIQSIDVNSSTQEHQRNKRDLTDEIRPTRTHLEPDEMRLTAAQKDELKISYALPKRQLSLPNTVRVIIHNLTHLTEDEVKQRNLDNQVDFIDPANQWVIKWEDTPITTELPSFPDRQPTRTRRLGIKQSSSTRSLWATSQFWQWPLPRTWNWYQPRRWSTPWEVKFLPNQNVSFVLPFSLLFSRIKTKSFRPQLIWRNQWPLH